MIKRTVWEKAVLAVTIALVYYLLGNTIERALAILTSANLLKLLAAGCSAIIGYYLVRLYSLVRLYCISSRRRET
jgi:hypothetical protein